MQETFLRLELPGGAGMVALSYGEFQAGIDPGKSDRTDRCPRVISVRCCDSSASHFCPQRGDGTVNQNHTDVLGALVAIVVDRFVPVQGSGLASSTHSKQ